jgi:hypothetical protein
MVALRHSHDPGEGQADARLQTDASARPREDGAAPHASDISTPARPDAADWLPLQQAACELNLSATTVRRMIRKGRLRNRIVPRRGGFAYLVYLPNSRHSQGLCGLPAPLPENVIPLHAPPQAEDGGRVRELEQQLDEMAEALARALRVKQKELPKGIGRPVDDEDDPYARYRWLVRRRGLVPALERITRLRR